jgi:hypothetical protein
MTSRIFIIYHKEGLSNRTLPRQAVVISGDSATSHPRIGFLFNVESKNRARKHLHRAITLKKRGDSGIAGDRDGL